MSGAARDWLADATETANRLSVKSGLTQRAELYGDHCVNCEQRWALPADQASCAHLPICEDCWPNGCPDCEAQVERDLRHREETTERIIAAALEIRTTADDLSETDLRLLGWRMRLDVRRHVAMTIDALRRVSDTLDAQDKRAGK